MGLVLLDMDHREQRAVELEAGYASGNFAAKDVDSGLQLYTGRTEFFRSSRKLLERAVSVDLEGKGTIKFESIPWIAWDGVFWIYRPIGHDEQKTERNGIIPRTADG